MATADLGEVGVAEGEEPVERLGVEFRRELCQQTSLRFCQEPNRYPADAAPIDPAAARQAIALVSSPLIL
jgi:hypothetical protein